MGSGEEVSRHHHHYFDPLNDYKPAGVKHHDHAGDYDHWSFDTYLHEHEYDPPCTDNDCPDRQFDVGGFHNEYHDGGDHFYGHS